MESVQAAADRNRIKLRFHGTETAAHDPFIAAVLVQDAECS